MRLYGMSFRSESRYIRRPSVISEVFSATSSQIECREPFRQNITTYSHTNWKLTHTVAYLPYLVSCHRIPRALITRRVIATSSSSHTCFTSVSSREVSASHARDYPVFLVTKQPYDKLAVAIVGVTRSHRVCSKRAMQQRVAFHRQQDSSLFSRNAANTRPEIAYNCLLISRSLRRRPTLASRSILERCSARLR